MDRLNPYPSDRVMGGFGGSYTFANGYGISVIRHRYSYGGNAGLYEIAVLKNDNICYTTPITDDVIGWLTEDSVVELMHRISRLGKGGAIGA